MALSVTKIFIDLTSTRSELQRDVLRRLQPTLLTLMSTSTPELPYTVLVHILALCQRGPESVEVFGPEFKQFFCRFNDPSYVKNVKIDILTLLADAGSAEPIVNELSEYVTDVDAEISRRAIRSIGKIAMRIESTAEMIVASLTTLLELDIDYVSTEASAGFGFVAASAQEKTEIIKLLCRPTGCQRRPTLAQTVEGKISEQ